MLHGICDVVYLYSLVSGPVSKALIHKLGASAEQMAAFAGTFDKLFDCLNVSSLSAGKLQHNAFKAPYHSAVAAGGLPCILRENCESAYQKRRNTFEC